MISVIVEDYKAILSECYSADSDLVTKWHTITGLQECIEKEFADLQQAKVKFFKVVSENVLAGYFCKESFADNDFLTGFFLMPKFRTEKFKNAFWQLVQSELAKPFYCGLYENNIPANRFIKNRGGSLMGQVTLPDGLANYFKLGE